ncbi:MAG: class I SAM-dependent methyltransferase, partial [Anaerolineales bacterium]
LKRILADQAAKPRGLLGRVAGRLMARVNLESNEWVVSLLDVQMEDHVLEIGFGPGTAIREAAQEAKEGHVAGIDISEAMVALASSLNQEAIDVGRVDLRLGEAASLPWEVDRFDKVFAVNVIYLWPRLDPILKEIRRVLKQGGLVALYLAPLEIVERLGFREIDLFTIHSSGAVQQAFKESGFVQVEQESARIGDGIAVCVMARK